MLKLRKNDIVHVVFLDHCDSEEGSIPPVECHVIGRYAKRGKKQKQEYILVETWFLGPGVDPEVARGNTKTSTILTSTIVKIARLVPEDAV